MIGITERGDPRFDKSWISKIDNTDFTVLITKGLAHMVDEVIEHKDKILLHVTCTGLGGTIVEPYVPTAEQTREAFERLLEKGFDPTHAVLRIDPIFPTINGMRHVHKAAQLFEDSGIKRMRVSIVDMYPHVVKRFQDANVKLPFEGKQASVQAIDDVAKSLTAYSDTFEIESCAERNLWAPVGCVSQKDCDIMGCNIQLTGNANQRKGCLCPSQKVELLSSCKQCPHHCLYCYWWS